MYVCIYYILNLNYEYSYSLCVYMRGMCLSSIFCCACQLLTFELSEALLSLPSILPVGALGLQTYTHTTELALHGFWDSILKSSACTASTLPADFSSQPWSVYQSAAL